MDITVILCTYNRAECLGTALSSAAALVLPESVEWEILVVDNNSTDRTREVVQDFCSRYPSRFRYVFEPRQGLCRARNSGVREARGHIIAFMDDDVTVEPTWLQSLTSRLHDSKWGGAGGRVLPARSFTVPDWLALEGPTNMGGVLAIFDLGDKAGELDRAPFGNNMAFRREMFQQYGCFRTDLDRCGSSMLSGGDIEFGRRVMAAGARLCYEPSAIVYHAVPDNRLKKEYFLKFWFGSGRTEIRTMDRRPDILGIPRLYLSFLKHTLVIAPEMIIRWLFSFGLKNRFYRKCWVWLTAGEILELYRQLFVANSQEQNPLPRIEAEPGPSSGQA